MYYYYYFLLQYKKIKLLLFVLDPHHCTIISYRMTIAYTIVSYRKNAKITASKPQHQLVRYFHVKLW